MAETDKIYSGKVQTIMTFGAFVTLEDGSTGLVHISEISDNYVKDVNDYLRVGQDVRVVELQTDEKSNKKRLSIKRAGEVLKPFTEEENREAAEQKAKADREKKEIKKRNRMEARKSDFSVPPPMFDEGKSESNADFGDKLAKFMKESEERLVDIKHQTENKRGGGYVRRG